MISIAPYLAAVAALAAVVLWGARVSWRAAGLYTLALAAVLAAAVDVLGRPKPVWVEWREFGEVVGIHYVPDVAIYVWVAGDPPRAYALPWSDEKAREAQEHQRTGLPLRMDYVNQEPVIHPIPRLPDPPKQ